MGRLGALLGPSWGPLGPPWGHLGGLLGDLWGFLGRRKVEKKQLFVATENKVEGEERELTPEEIQ